MKFKVGFTGTQNNISVLQKKYLKIILDIIDPKEVHHGDCIGADKICNDFCQKKGIPVHIHPPKLDVKRAFCSIINPFDIIYPKKDYIERNHDIVDSTDLLIATPKNNFEELRSGTWATIRYARREKKSIIIIYPKKGTLWEV